MVRHTIAVICALSEFIAERELEEAVFLVLYIINGQAFLGLCDSEILLEINKLRLDRLYLSVLNSLYEGTLLVAVGLNRRDGRLINLLL